MPLLGMALLEESRVSDSNWRSKLRSILATEGPDRSHDWPAQNQ